MRLAIFVTATVCALGCGHECRDLARDYVEALPAAKRCDPAAADPCAQPLTGSLDQPSCSVYVVPGQASTLQELIHKYASLGCQQPTPPTCPTSVVPRCEEQDGGVGVCTP
jgi:hypothetical protein